MSGTSVFVSYRRDDSKHAAGRLGERLDQRFNLFMDIDSIRPGTDFTAVVRDAVDHADVVLALIGSSWLDMKDETGARRLDSPDDWVALEVGTALEQGTPVIPVLVDGAHMPDRSQLPPALAELANRQAIKLTHESFPQDCTRLIETIETLVGREHSPDVDLWADPDYPAARSALLQGRWSAAIEGLERVLQRHPREQKVIDQLADAQRRQHLLELDERARAAAADDNWTSAVDALDEIQALSPTDLVGERLNDARRRLQIQSLHQDMRALADRGDWAGVVAADEQLTELDRDSADHQGLATRARSELVEERLAADYRRGLEELDAGRWEDGESTFASILALRPGYRDCEELIAVASRRGAPSPRPTADVENAPDPAAVVPVKRSMPARGWVAAAVAAVVMAGVVVGVVVATGGDDDPGGTAADLGSSAGPSSGTDLESDPEGEVGPSSEGSVSALPPASGTELVAASELSLDSASGTFAMAARTGGVRIDRLADVEQFGTGADARIRPDGGRLLAFHLTKWPCAVDPCKAWSKLDLAVAVGSDLRPLPDAGGTYVVAVPEGTTNVDLVMKVDGATQSLSLLTGEPGADNIAVLARATRTVRIDAAFPLTDTTSIDINYGDGARRTARRDVVVRSASLAYYVAGRSPRSPKKAYLVFDATFTRPYGVDQRYAMKTEEMQFRGDDGTVYRRIDAPALDFDTWHTETLFEVPADLTGGTLLVGGMTREATATNGQPYLDTLSAKAVEVHFP